MSSGNPSNSMIPTKSGLVNILTIDLEDYYQVSAFEGIVKREDWNKYESRLERSTYRLLEILEESGKSRSAKGIANEPTPNSSRLAQSAERIANEPTPVASGLEPCTLHPVPCGQSSSPLPLAPHALRFAPRFSIPNPSFRQQRPAHFGPIQNGYIPPPAQRNAGPGRPSANRF